MILNVSKLFEFLPTTLVFVVALLIIQTARSQDGNVPYTPPSPEAAALLEYASVPVSLYTGTAEIAVPLHRLEGRRSSIPISINYHASGIKVQDLATSVGLGWSLNAGGVITRIVRGLPDEGVNGYFSRPFEETFNDTEGMHFGTIDSEPDLYFYNFNGQTGKVVMNHSKDVIQFPHQDLRISRPDFTSSDPKWEITDVNGVRYVFGGTTNSREQSQIKWKKQYAPDPDFITNDEELPETTFSAITAWYLEEIHYPFSSEVITFEYLGSGPVFYENYSQSQSRVIEEWPAECGSVAPDQNVFDHLTQVTVQSAKYIQRINSSLGKVEFFYENDREDLTNALRLSSLRILNFDGLEIRGFKFSNNGYFVSDGCSTSDCKRLKLTSIYETTNGISFLYRTFSYSLTNLPSRKSVKYDHWGYYNNNAYKRAIPPSKTYVKHDLSSVSFPGADKSPDLTKTMANILTGVLNQAGGTQQIFYELNEFDNNGIITTTGGLRVGKIVEDDGTGINGSIVRLYHYRRHSDDSKSSGRTYRGHYYDFRFFMTVVCDDPSNAATAIWAQRYSASYVDLFDIGGSHVGYSDVGIEYSNGGKEKLYFTNYSDHPDDEPVFSIPNNYGQNNSIDFTDPDGPPFIGKGDRSYERGLLREHVFYNASGGKVKLIRNFYDFYEASSLKAEGGRAMILEVSGPALWGRQARYTYFHRGVRLQETIEKQFDTFNDDLVKTKRKTYTYNSIAKTLVKTETSYQGDGSEVKIEYQYPKDYDGSFAVIVDPESSGILELADNHVWGTPIETITSLKKPGSVFKVLSSKLTTYTKDDGISHPFQQFKLEVTSPLSDFRASYVYKSSTSKSFRKDDRYTLVTTYLDYDQQGNLLTELPIDGIRLGYSWGYNSSLVSAITKNPTTVPTTTTYQHVPLVGLTSLTDPASRKTFYLYDNANRLKLIKDHDSNIVTRFTYHYKNNNDLLTGFECPSSAPALNNVTFRAITSESLGATTIIWDFGDGQVIEGAESTIVHQYARPGIYTVKLSKINKEYGSSTDEKSITIY